MDGLVRDAAGVELHPGDIVQINPEHERWPGQFLVLDEVRSIRLRGFLSLTHHGMPVRVRSSGLAFLFVKPGEEERVGKIVWVPKGGKIPMEDANEATGKASKEDASPKEA